MGVVENKLYKKILQCFEIKFKSIVKCVKEKKILPTQNYN